MPFFPFNYASAGAVVPSEHHKTCLCEKNCEIGECWMRLDNLVPCVCDKECVPGKCPGKICSGMDIWGDMCEVRHHRDGHLCDECERSTVLDPEP